MARNNSTKAGNKRHMVAASIKKCAHINGSGLGQTSAVLQQENAQPKLKISEKANSNSTPLLNLSQRSCHQCKQPRLVINHHLPHKRRVYRKIGLCQESKVAKRNKPLAKLQKLYARPSLKQMLPANTFIRHLLYKLKPIDPALDMAKLKKRKTEPVIPGPDPKPAVPEENASHALGQARVEEAPIEEAADSSSVTSSDDQAKSVSSEDSVSPPSTAITTPDLSDTEAEPATKVSTVSSVAFERTITSTVAKTVFATLITPAQPPKASRPLKAAPADISSSTIPPKPAPSPRVPTSSNPLPTCTPANRLPICTPANSSKKRKIAEEEKPAQPPSPKKTKLVQPSRPKEYFELRIDEMLNNPLGFDDLVHDDPRPRKAQQIFNTFRKYRRAQGRPIPVTMSGAIGAPQPPSPTKKGEANPKRTPTPPSPGPSQGRDLSKNVLKKEHQKKVTQDIAALKKGKRPLTTDDEEGEEEEEEKGHAIKRARKDDSLRVKGYIGNKEDRTCSEGGILLGVVSPQLRTGPRTVRNAFGQGRRNIRFGR